MLARPNLRQLTVDTEDKEKEKDQRLFAFEMQDDALKVGLLCNKAIAIAKSISNIFHQKALLNGHLEAECQTCQSKFMTFFKKRHVCSMCHHSFCQK